MKTIYAIGSTLLAFAAIGIAPALAATAVPDSEHVNQLLSDAKTQAYQLREDASTMESYTRSPGISWQTHATTITQMKEHINAAGRILTKLDEARKTASPWQATAIDRITPLLKELANNTEHAIDYINKEPKRLMMPKYESYIEANADVSDELASLIGDFVDYGSTKDRLESLTNKLELSGD